jgi:hypothetical protein
MVAMEHGHTRVENIVVPRRRLSTDPDRPDRKWPFGRLLAVGVTLGLWALIGYACVRIAG